MKKIHGFVNVDALAAVNPDSRQDVFALPKVKLNSVDLIYACHVLEHSKRNSAQNVLMRWRSVLKPGGVLRLAVPDIEKAMKWYLMHGDLQSISGFLWGGQRNEYDHHGIGFDYPLLAEMLRKCGFDEIERWNWRDTEHAHVDDYSQSYLPHMDKVRGLLMSLNVQARKP